MEEWSNDDTVNCQLREFWIGMELGKKTYDDTEHPENTEDPPTSDIMKTLWKSYKHNCLGDNHPASVFWD